MSNTVHSIESFLNEKMNNAQAQFRHNAQYIHAFIVAMIKNGFEVKNVSIGDKHIEINNGNHFEALDYIFSSDESVLNLKKDSSVVSCIVHSKAKTNVIPDYSIQAPRAKSQEIDGEIQLIFNTF